MAAELKRLLAETLIKFFRKDEVEPALTKLLAVVIGPEYFHDHGMSSRWYIVV